MRYLVYGKEQVLVRRRAENVGEEPELPREERRVPQHMSQVNLENDDAGDNVFGQRLRAAKLGNLWSTPRLVSRGKQSVGWGVVQIDRTSGCALMMASRLVLWGSSV